MLIRYDSTKALAVSLSCALAICSLTSAARAETSGELFTRTAYQFGRVDARIQFAGGGGVVGAFFLWKDGSEKSEVFWNELDFEKVEADCHLETNAFYGLPERTHTQSYDGMGDYCGTFHTYTYEWTPDYIAWALDGVEVRRETGEAVQAFAENAAEGMQIRFNVWPGDATFGGVFDPGILPVHQYVNWVQYSAYVNGAFELAWREDFTADTIPSGWATGSWDSPKGLSTHSASNVTFAGGYAILSLTADTALGSAGAMPMDPEGSGPGAGGSPSGGATGCSVGASGQSRRGHEPWLVLGLLGVAMSRRRSLA